VLTGQDCCKTQAEVDRFGGFEGNYEGNVPFFDGGCVDLRFRWCDNLDNNDFDVMTFISRTFANMVANMAFDKQIMSASNNYQRGRQSRVAAPGHAQPHKRCACRRAPWVRRPALNASRH
jgi:hypothetical protein